VLVLKQGADGQVGSINPCLVQNRHGEFYTCGDLPFTSRGRWQCFRVGADAGLNSFYAACGCGAEYRRGVLPGRGAWRHAL